ncbi:DUF4349 domain-containing protein [Pallidibacillus thermolactis]|uniref:DUF4349 domain-containing protein n=1 Tax=Pallidibacillus thermolactis TaxID=251051 RepID=UPI0021DA5110|nr:DUF4349 domain-containing protein [Pallidibacillus thermolactis]MCU9601678.1 DUF4349 domain-containing protein [Pallidibacillus thermolactis subsp. kokeshiiformis]
MKKVAHIVFCFFIVFLLTACSTLDEKGSDAHSQKMYDHASSAEESRQVEQDLAVEPEQSYLENKKTMEGTKLDDMGRKVTYSATLQVEVNDYHQSLDNIAKKVKDWNGYIVTSTMYGENNSIFGDITVRIPQQHFQAFISFIEKDSYKVKNKSISGDGVTEEYVDLNSRLKSKRAVESRLMTLMEQAETTEDLLAVTKDLAMVQEEIETILGRMNYLENRIEFATITIHLTENNTKLTDQGVGTVNTWEKSKEMFMKSVKILMQLVSTMTVFFIGGLPIIIVISITLFITVILYKYLKQRKKE